MMSSFQSPGQHTRSQQEQQLKERVATSDLPTLRALLDRYLPLEICEQFGIVPLGVEGFTCSFGACNPRMMGLWDGLALLEEAGYSVRLERIPSEIHADLMMQLRSSAALESVKTPVTPAGTASTSTGIAAGSFISHETLQALNQNLSSTESSPDEDQADENAPIVRVVRSLIEEALTRGVSDIHVEAQESCCRVRLRKDGILHNAAELPAASIVPLIARIKVMAKLNIAERRMPQDGALRVTHNGKAYDLRVSTLPGRHGEKAVMRVLDSGAVSLKLNDLVHEERERNLLRQMASRPHGILVVSGPTGAGKSTTLHALLQERNDPSINIVTVEDPVEYTVDGIHQVQVIREKGLDFARALRAFMRQDPDIILVGETRDPETAKTAVEASLTGHLVFTTLHANDSITSIPRLVEMGVEPYLLSSSLVGVCTQRLVRRVCPDCSQTHYYAAQELSSLGLTRDGSFRQARELRGLELQQATLAGQVCPTCGGLGYVGRLGVYEVALIDDTLRQLIAGNAPYEELRRYAHDQQGMRTLLEYAVALLQQGLTTVEEVRRICLSA